MDRGHDMYVFHMIDIAKELEDDSFKKHISKSIFFSHCVALDDCLVSYLNWFTSSLPPHHHSISSLL